MTARTWSTTRRMEFIEFRLYWYGRINRRDLCEMFGISVPQSANDLRNYLEAAPGNTVYDRRRKSYIVKESFRPVFFRPSASEYFEHLQRAGESDGKLGRAWATGEVPFALSPIVKRKMSSEIVRTVTLGIREERPVRVVYQSMTSSKPGPRTISPHAVASDGFRWHVRGYHHEKKRYRDFVLARILKAAVDETGYVDGRGDGAWHETVTVVISTNPGLNPSQRRAYEFDLGMVGGKLEVPVRRALLHYFLTEMRLDFDKTFQKPARVAPLVVSNFDEVQRCLFSDR